MASKRIESLKKRTDFLNLKKNGNFIRANDWLLVNFKSNKQSLTRSGLTISKKIGNAVTRNKLKRWVREFVRKLESDGIDFNIIFKSQNKEFYKNLSHQELDAGLRTAFNKIARKRTQKRSPSS